MNLDHHFAPFEPSDDAFVLGSGGGPKGPCTMIPHKVTQRQFAWVCVKYDLFEEGPVGTTTFSPPHVIMRNYGFAIPFVLAIASVVGALLTKGTAHEVLFWASWAFGSLFAWWFGGVVSNSSSWKCFLFGTDMGYEKDGLGANNVHWGNPYIVWYCDRVGNNPRPHVGSFLFYCEDGTTWEKCYTIEEAERNGSWWKKGTIDKYGQDSKDALADAIKHKKMLWGGK